MAFIVCNLLYLCYLIGTQPKDEGFRQEVINEVTTLVLSYLMLIYNDNVGDTNIRYFFSLVFIGTFMLNVLINLSILIVFSIRKSYLIIKKFIMMRKY